MRTCAECKMQIEDAATVTKCGIVNCPELHSSDAPTLTEQDIKRFRIGDILFNDEQARMFCDLALKGLRAEALRTVNPDMLAALRDYSQQDPDGLFVGVSRQALDEAIAILSLPPSAIPSAMVGPRITFMYDNHTFRAIDVLDRAKASQQIMACFAEDGCGGAFIQWGSADGERPRDTSRPKNYVLHGHMMGEGKRWGVTDWELEAFLDHFYAIEPREVDRRKK